MFSAFAAVQFPNARIDGFSRVIIIESNPWEKKCPKTLLISFVSGKWSPVSLSSCEVSPRTALRPTPIYLITFMWKTLIIVLCTSMSYQKCNPCICKGITMEYSSSWISSILGTQLTTSCSPWSYCPELQDVTSSAFLSKCWWPKRVRIPISRNGNKHWRISSQVLFRLPR